MNWTARDRLVLVAFLSNPLAAAASSGCSISRPVGRRGTRTRYRGARKCGYAPSGLPRSPKRRDSRLRGLRDRDQRAETGRAIVIHQRQEARNRFLCLQRLERIDNQHAA